MAERATAFAPGRVNLIGEHTDYNEGLALPFAIGEGVTVRATRTPGDRERASSSKRSGPACSTSSSSSVVPVVLGDGVRLLEGLPPLKLEVTRVIDAPGVTHLTYKLTS